MYNWIMTNPDVLEAFKEIKRIRSPIFLSFYKFDDVIYLVVKLVRSWIRGTVSDCTWPTALQNGVWIDSDKGYLTFNATHMFGWRLKTIVSSTVVTDWVCQNNTDKFLVARASTDIDPLKSSFIAFLCLNITQISNYSFYYYQHSGEQLNSNGERFAITFSSSFTSFISNLSNICSEIPAISEFHMLLKQGFQNESKVYCPDAFLGMFSYTFNNGSTAECGNHNELWDVCSDRKVMTFNYNACTALITYSALGRVYCVNSLTSGSYYYAAVYNTDVDDTAYRFTCLMGSLSGNDVKVSQSPKSCTKTQIPTSIPVTANGTSLGAFMFLTAYNTCRFEIPSTSTSTTSTSTTSTSTTRESTTQNVVSTVGGVTTNVTTVVRVTTPNVGAIVGGTVGGLLFLVALVGSIILLYLCALKKKPPKKLLEEKYTKGKIAERKQNTPYMEDKKENSLTKVKDERGNDTWETEVITSKIVEQNKIMQKTGEKINFTNEFLFSKEGTGLDVTQLPPMETAYRQTPIFNRDRSTIVLVTENVPKKTSDTNAPKTDGKSSSIIMTPAANRTGTAGNAGRFICSSPSPFLENEDALSISKEYDEDGYNHVTSNATSALSVGLSRSSPFRESDISTEPQQEYSETDSACEYVDDDAKKDAAEAEKDQIPLDKPRPAHGHNSLTEGKKLAKNAVSGFDKYGGLPPLDFDSPNNKSPKHKRRRKKKRKSKSKHESGKSLSSVRKFSLRPTLRSSAGSQVSSSDMSIFETSVIQSAQTDSSVSGNGDLKMKGLLSRHPGTADPDLYGKDIRIREIKSTITNPATPTTSTGLGEVASGGQGPVTVDIP
ncbi:hypothetical protein CHS0354_006649 [Potamilus streckersoni]|uniref:DUF7042 domain-containing protein n=1 Tax=Potamilus streckersoni TaxID=2493646 RepID=A0AAE0W425_9BIVA|nr:hypothetical protein CHS0354_006649 [Potamilus streckersoni]